MKPWARIDCDILDNGKVAALKFAHEQLAYIAVLLYCKAQRNGGVFDASIPFRRFTSRAPAQTRNRLIEVGLLVERNGALIVPNWETKQPMTDDDRRERDAERKRLKRAQASQRARKVRGHSADKPRTDRGQNSDALAGARKTDTATETETTALPPDKELLLPDSQPPPACMHAEEGRLTESSDGLDPIGDHLRAALPARRAAPGVAS